VALQPEYGRQRQPQGGEDRPRPHRNNDRITLDGGTIDLDTRRAALAHSDPAYPTVPQLCALCLGGTHHRGGKLAGMDLGRGFGRAQGLSDCYGIGQPP